ncbi:MAG: phosphate-starvation-inducible PsiE family protein [Candidatus Binatia bacterium]
MFTRIEDVIYVGLGLLLAGIAGALLIAEIIFFAQYIFTGILSENIVTVLDRILLIIIFVEVLYTVQVSFRQHVLQPGPFLVVGLIAVTRRILVLTAELPKIMSEGDALFQNAMMELGLLTVFDRRAGVFSLFDSAARPEWRRGGRFAKEKIAHVRASAVSIPAVHLISAQHGERRRWIFD